MPAGDVTALESKGYAVTAQARMSPRLLALADAGFFPIYREKNQAGLELRDCRAEPLFGARFPQRAYRRFEDVPPVLVDALLFIENQDLLDARQGTRNPAVDWDRLGRAVLDQMLHVVDNAHPTAGGSTLATQIE
ncbi:MAG TPA: transglycosylase domain-containing protein, partial [Burkholderiaceae bacterium]|nr:transglycosylase domain-containing protein [Burkholderiaceae bacterium]